jgi:spore coat protein A
MLVNGTAWPTLEVDAVRYRFRILNGCNARRLDLALDPGPSHGSAFTQVGSDGGLLQRPRGHDHLQVAQAERFDVVVDFSSYPVGSRIVMLNRLGEGRMAQVMQFVVARRAREESSIPSRLSTIEPLDTSGASVREWRFSRGRINGRPGWVINGEPFDPEQMQAQISLDEVEIWRFHSDLHHPVHVHLDPFQVLSRGGYSPGEFDDGWKDTVDVRPAEHVDVAVRFSEHAGRFLIHCHNLEHEDRMMMAAFATCRPGAR